MQLLALVQDSLRHAFDRKIFWVLVAITLAVAAVMTCVGFDGDRISVLFGLWKPKMDHYSPLSDLGRTRLAGLVVHGLMDVFLGWIGITLMVIATAGVFPAMMERGAIDVVLGKPIGRPKLFLYKYIAGMVFVLLQAVLFVGLTFLIMGLRWNVWRPGYLLSIPLIVLLFSYVHCVSVLVVVYTRSTVAAILLSLAAWVCFALVSQAPALFQTFPELKKHPRFHRVVRAVSWIPPKTGDIPFLAAKWAEAGTSVDAFPEDLLGPGTATQREFTERSRKWEEKLLKSNPWVSIGSSLAFETVVLFLALWKFTRQDF
jgi:ABC-type transport system involved in multi-copper enzyme maturation permease subunit